MDAWLALPQCFCLHFLFLLSIFLAISCGCLYFDQQAKEPLENRALFGLLFSSELETHSTTGFIISGLLSECVVRIGRNPMVAFLLYIVLSTVVFQVSGHSGLSGWSWGRRNVYRWHYSVSLVKKFSSAKQKCFFCF